MNLEEELKHALQRKEPPLRFRERVLAECGAGPLTRADGRVREPAPHFREPAPHYRSIAAAVLLTAIIGGTTARWIEQRREGERAKEQVLLALRITSHKLRDTREQIHELSNH
jgi:hypothetical protein